VTASGRLRVNQRLRYAPSPIRAAKTAQAIVQQQGHGNL